MRHPPCRFCRAGERDTTIRSSEDAKAYFDCFDYRWPRMQTCLRGIVSQLERIGRVD